MGSPSHSNERGPLKESSSSSSDCAGQPTKDAAPQQTSPPAVAPPPHMMYQYYPPPMGYPSQGHGYPPGGGYPTEYHPNQAYHNYPPPHPYYDPGPQPQTYQTSGRRSGAGFIRGFVMCCCIMLATLFIIALFTSLILHPRNPAFKVVSLSVENFNTTAPLSGNWNAVASVDNPNDRLRGFFSDFKMELVYRSDQQVAWGYAPGFELGTRERREVAVRPLSPSGGTSVDVGGIAKEREGGSVTFTLRIYTAAAFKTSTVSTRGETVLAVCEGLKVVFQSNTNNGALDNSGKPSDCLLYV